ncbi:hypothetical protein TWF694_011203 [Orbilia ellipsospora]|uniref:Uncharacterized protein n=1 Tax=Orbilia ellipsospora TaxID=2528407 RepID=A0AAV9X9D3_9PEZI
MLDCDETAFTAEPHKCCMTCEGAVCRFCEKVFCWECFKLKRAKFKEDYQAYMKLDKWCSTTCQDCFETQLSLARTELERVRVWKFVGVNINMRNMREVMKTHRGYRWREPYRPRIEQDPELRQKNETEEEDTQMGDILETAPKQSLIESIDAYKVHLTNVVARVEAGRAHMKAVKAQATKMKNTQGESAELGDSETNDTKKEYFKLFDHEMEEHEMADNKMKEGEMKDVELKDVEMDDVKWDETGGNNTKADGVNGGELNGEDEKPEDKKPDNEKLEDQAIDEKIENEKTEEETHTDEKHADGKLEDEKAEDQKAEDKEIEDEKDRNTEVRETKDWGVEVNESINKRMSEDKQIEAEKIRLEQEKVELDSTEHQTQEDEQMVEERTNEKVEDKPMEDKPIEDKPMEDKSMDDNLVEDGQDLAAPKQDQPMEDVQKEDRSREEEQPKQDKEIPDVSRGVTEVNSGSESSSDLGVDSGSECETDDSDDLDSGDSEIAGEKHPILENMDSLYSALLREATKGKVLVRGVPQLLRALRNARKHMGDYKVTLAAEKALRRKYKDGVRKRRLTGKERENPLLGYKQSTFLGADDPKAQPRGWKFGHGTPIPNSLPKERENGECRVDEDFQWYPTDDEIQYFEYRIEDKGSPWYIDDEGLRRYDFIYEGNEAEEAIEEDFLVHRRRYFERRRKIKKETRWWLKSAYLPTTWDSGCYKKGVKRAVEELDTSDEDEAIENSRDEGIESSSEAITRKPKRKIDVDREKFMKDKQMSMQVNNERKSQSKRMKVRFADQVGLGLEQHAPDPSISVLAGAQVLPPKPKGSAVRLEGAQPSKISTSGNPEDDGLGRFPYYDIYNEKIGDNDRGYYGL